MTSSDWRRGRRNVEARRLGLLVRREHVGELHLLADRRPAAVSSALRRAGVRDADLARGPALARVIAGAGGTTSTFQCVGERGSEAVGAGEGGDLPASSAPGRGRALRNSKLGPSATFSPSTRHSYAMPAGAPRFGESLERRGLVERELGQRLRARVECTSATTSGAIAAISQLTFAPERPPCRHADFDGDLVVLVDVEREARRVAAGDACRRSSTLVARSVSPSASLRRR